MESVAVNDVLMLRSHTNLISQGERWMRGGSYMRKRTKSARYLPERRKAAESSRSASKA